MTTDSGRPLLRSVLPPDLESAVTRFRKLTSPDSISSHPLFLPLAGLSLLAIVLLLVAVLYAMDVGSSAGLFGAGIAALILLLLIATVTRRLRTFVLEPTYKIRQWIVRLMDGDLDARMTDAPGSGASTLIPEMHLLGDSIGRMCRSVDQQARLQLDQLAQKTRALEVLYDAAAGIDVMQDLDDLLNRFLHTLRDLVQARAGVVRLMNEDGSLRLIASEGCRAEALVRVVSATQCLNGARFTEALLMQSDLSQSDVAQCAAVAPREGAVVVTIPIRYSDRTLGAYNLLLDDAQLVRREDISHLFSSIGRHLGIAIEKARLERHARRLSIMEERTLLANELHDSLAQTLASLRLQVSLVEETVGQSKDRTGIRQIRTIKEGLDQGNNQLRELLAHFRTRMDERGLVPAIESVVERFRNETGIAAFFQNEIGESNLPPSLEVQVLHIVQEALTNVRKHSNAQNVRVLLRAEGNDDYHVLVEDDGQGIEEKVVSDPPGEHIGLSIMRERAGRLSGNLSIESEPGEGTRVELQFHVHPQQRRRMREIEGASHE